MCCDTTAMDIFKSWIKAGLDDVSNLFVLSEELLE